MKEQLASHKLDDALKDFYDRHNIEISSLLNQSSSQQSEAPFLYRFVRLNPRYDNDETLQLLTNELHDTRPIHVPWLPDDSFYAIPADFALSTSKCFQSGRLYGMDVSSGAAVSVLLSDTHDITKGQFTIESKVNRKKVRVLDLCCCPGLKLCAIADRVSPGSTVVGVDISEHRMALCSKIVQKYHIESSTRGATDSPVPDVKIQLYGQDGTTFATLGVEPNLIFDSRIALEEEAFKGTRKRKNKSARAREKKRLKQMTTVEHLAGQHTNTICLPNINNDPDGVTSIHDKDVKLQRPLSTVQQLFDHVLVDAECSTDGSLKHLRERLKETTSSTQQNQLVTDKEKLAGLVDLQRRLLESGYRLLKPGGTLVYSTCSLSQDQNEDVVQWLLDKHTDAFVIPVHFFSSPNSNKLVFDGSLPGTVRFHPNLGKDADVLFGDGFFLAKIGKRASKV